MASCSDAAVGSVLSIHKKGNVILSIIIITTIYKVLAMYQEQS